MNWTKPTYLIFGVLLAVTCKTKEDSKPSIQFDSVTKISFNELSDYINLDSLLESCGSDKNCWVRKNLDSLNRRKDYSISTYDSITDFSVSLKSFNGRIFEYNSTRGGMPQPSSVHFRDKEVWLAYCRTQLDENYSEFHIGTNNSFSTLVSYYNLLGVDSRIEYGWICEYSTVGMATDQREAVIGLLGQEELLIKLLDAPLIETRLYAADALLYIEHRNNEFKREFMNRDNYEQYSDEMDDIGLDESVLRKIDDLTLNKDTVRTCGNSGSWKIYPGKCSEILSDSARKVIPLQYEYLKSSGYFGRNTHNNL